MIRRLLFLAFLPAALQAATFTATFPERSEWPGPAFWPNPLYAWSADGGDAVVEATKGTELQLLTRQVTDAASVFELSTTIRFSNPGEISMKDRVWAGFSIGIRSGMDDYRHRLVHGASSLQAGVRVDGSLFLGKRDTGAVVDPARPVQLTLRHDGNGRVELIARQESATEESVAWSGDPATVIGNLALAAESPRKHGDQRGPVIVRFESWSVDGLAVRDEQAFGPILWTQYTLAGGTLKMTAQMAPVEGEATLELQRGGEWVAAGSSPIDPLSRTAHFRIDDWQATEDVPYRIRFAWEGETHGWNGTVRREPTDANRFSVASFSCDHGYAFPLPGMVQNVLRQDPDLVFFAGDQIYEGYGGFGVLREHSDRAFPDYLRKYYQFGWSWRDVLKDRPSIIIPDDHDVFQGNLWGHGGRPFPDGGGQEHGGYRMHPDWVNAVQRTQTGHLPDPPDPRPVAQGIGVYFTAFEYAGIAFAVLEDRKFKSGPAAVLPEDRRKRPPEELDVDGAELLGPRQEKFLADFARKTSDAPLRLVLSQTIFCKASTHSGSKLRPGGYDFDSGGWPQSGRKRALQPLLNNPRTVMLHGDQHYGVLVQHGVESHGDGPYAFMVPGTANGFPRAWWPKGPEGGAATWTGDFADPFGNKFTVLAAGNPDPGSNTMNPRGKDDPETTARKKGSGHGLTVFDRDARSVTFHLYRYAISTDRTGWDDQFPGFPVTVPLR